jgi:hypothetical protein
MARTAWTETKEPKVHVGQAAMTAPICPMDRKETRGQLETWGPRAAKEVLERQDLTDRTAETVPQVPMAKRVLVAPKARTL